MLRLKLYKVLHVRIPKGYEISVYNFSLVLSADNVIKTGGD